MYDSILIAEILSHLIIIDQSLMFKYVQISCTVATAHNMPTSSLLYVYWPIPDPGTPLHLTILPVAWLPYIIQAAAPLLYVQCSVGIFLQVTPYT
jgi:hypothetical protein